MTRRLGASTLLAFLSLTLLALVITDCHAAGQTISHSVAYNEREVVPSVIHQVVYHMMEDCTGLRGDFAKIHWHVAQAIIIQGPGYVPGQMAEAMWSRDSETGERHIIFDYDSYYNAETISHEALHDLYNGDAPLDVSQRCILSWRNAQPTQ